MLVKTRPTASRQGLVKNPRHQEIKRCNKQVHPLELVYTLPAEITPNHFVSVRYKVTSTIDSNPLVMVKVWVPRLSRTLGHKCIASNSLRGVAGAPLMHDTIEVARCGPFGFLIDKAKPALLKPQTFRKRKIFFRNMPRLR